jgi:hypothetical protein
MTRYASDASTLLLLAAGNLRLGPQHQLVAPNLIRSRSLSFASTLSDGGTFRKTRA